MPDAKISSDELVTLEPTDFIPAIRGTSNVRVAGSNVMGGGASVQQATVTLSQYASTNITATAVLGVWELPASGVMFTPVMTSNTTPFGEAFASTEYTNSDTYKAWRAFNNNTSDYWASAAAAPPHSVGFDYITPVIKNIYSVDCVSRAGYAIKSWKFQGGESKTGPWTTLDTRTNITSWGQVNTYSFTNTTAYRCYRLYITECVSGTDTDICELKLGTASNVILNPATDYLALRPYATGSQTTTIIRLKTGSEAMVIDYI